MITRKIILSEVANYFDVNFLDLKNKKSKSTKYTYPRQMYSTLCRQFTNSSLTSIGEFINKHHAAVIHGEKTIKNLAEVDKTVKKDLDNLQKIIIRYGDSGVSITKSLTTKMIEHSEIVLDNTGSECYLIKGNDLQDLSNELYLILKQI